MSGIFTHRALYTNFGNTVTEIKRAECWELYNPRTEQRVSLTNCPANLVLFHDYLKASWQLVNDDESLAGLEDKE